MSLQVKIEWTHNVPSQMKEVWIQELEIQQSFNLFLSFVVKTSNYSYLVKNLANEGLSSRTSSKSTYT